MVPRDNLITSYHFTSVMAPSGTSKVDAATLAVSHHPQPQCDAPGEHYLEQKVPTLTKRAHSRACVSITKLGCRMVASAQCRGWSTLLRGTTPVSGPAWD